MKREKRKRAWSCQVLQLLRLFRTKFPREAAGPPGCQDLLGCFNGNGAKKPSLTTPFLCPVLHKTLVALDGWAFLGLFLALGSNPSGDENQPKSQARLHIHIYKYDVPTSVGQSFPVRMVYNRPRLSRWKWARLCVCIVVRLTFLVGAASKIAMWACKVWSGAMRQWMHAWFAGSCQIIWAWAYDSVVLGRRVKES